MLDARFWMLDVLDAWWCSCSKMLESLCSNSLDTRKIDARSNTNKIILDYAEIEVTDGNSRILNIEGRSINHISNQNWDTKS